MANTLEQLGLDRLSLNERLALVDDLWESILAEPEAYRLTSAQEIDLRRRLEAYLDDPKAGSPWKEAKQRLMEQND